MKPSGAAAKSVGEQSERARAAARFSMVRGYDAVKVFSATKANERVDLGQKITAWLDQNQVDVVDTVVKQSSDNQFHCLSIIVFYKKA